MKHQYIPLYTSFFKESFPKTSTELAIKKACKIIGRRIGTKLYPSLIKQDVVKADGRKLSGIIATFDGIKQIRFNWKMTDTSSTIVGVDIWENVKQKLFTPTKELVFENDENIIQIIDAIVQAIQSKEKNAVLKIVESVDRMREDVIAVDTKTQGKVSQEIKRVIDQWSSDLDIDKDKLVNTRLSTLWSDYLYWKDEVNKDPSMKVLNYGTFRNYLIALMDKNGLKNIYMRQIVSKEGTKERILVTDEVSEKNFNEMIYSLSLSDTFSLVETDIQSVIQGMKPASLICGKAGVGKTEIVKNALHKAGSGIKVKYMKGSVKRPEDLYDMIVKNNESNQIIVMDDFDEPLLQYKKYSGILKSMLDPNLRILTFLSGKAQRPEEILLKSKFIIISNLSKEKIPEPVYSRTAPIEIKANPSEMIDYLEQNLNNIMKGVPQVTLEYKKEVLDFLRQYVKNIKHIDFRIFNQILIYRVTQPENPLWRKWAMMLLRKL